MYTYNYTNTMMMKLKMADPDKKGGTIIHINVEKAFEIIKTIDNLTLGVKKIIYLVGWQYLGHDDKYPAFFEANEGIKRECDASARDSIMWLIEEAKNFNTVVSLHVNFTDAYEDSPLFNEYIANKALIRNSNGKPAVIEKYNGKGCYKISYKEEWKSGLFVKRIDKLLDLYPIESIGTLHVDNFQCYVNRKPFISAEEMQYYRDLMIKYLRDKGIDITSEFTYREGKGSAMGYGKITRDFTPTRYPIALLNKIPAVWWVDKMTIEEYFAYYPHIYGGGLPKNQKARNLFYGNIHAEELFLQSDWQSKFLKEFLLVNVPFFYLNAKKRIGFIDKKRNKILYDDGTVTYCDGTIMHGDEIVKNRDNLFLHFMNGYVIYNSKGGRVQGKIVAGDYVLYEITDEGLREISRISSELNSIVVIVKPNTGYYLKCLE